MADVGLVGFPTLQVNADQQALPGTTRWQITLSPPRIPQLGVVKHNEQEAFVIADIPGLIEGAHEGRIGDRFCVTLNAPRFCC